MDCFREMSKNVGMNKMVEIEDLPALMYLQHTLIGAQEISKFKHIVIDEGQDFGAFQYDILRLIMKEATFTILGDIAQGINYHRGTSDWKAVFVKLVVTFLYNYDTLEDSSDTCVDFSGFSHTSSFSDQSLVSLVQRPGFLSFAVL